MVLSRLLKDVRPMVITFIFYELYFHCIDYRLNDNLTQWQQESKSHGLLKYV